MDGGLPLLAEQGVTYMPEKRLAQKFQDWVEARCRFHLSHVHVQMARELGLNPKKLGKIDNHDQEPWKLPLPHFIEHLYLKRFGRERPEVVVSIEERARQIEAKKAAKRARKLERRAARKDLAGVRQPDELWPREKSDGETWKLRTPGHG